MVLHTQIDPEEVTAHVQELAAKRAVNSSNRLADATMTEQRLAHTLPAPKFKISDHGVTAGAAADLVRRHLALDGKPSLNLASFVSTTVDEEGLSLMRENITKNLADSDEYPALIELQQRCVSILSNLWNVPTEGPNGTKGERGVGACTTGSSEAIHLGGLAMLRRWQARQKEAGRSTDRPNIIMGANAQVALEKFARYFEVEPRILPVHAADHFSFSMEDLYENIDENTIGVFAILGSTYTGHYQDVHAISAVLDKYERESGIDIPIHVDGASGAFVAPFCSPGLVWDFRLSRVKSINTSGHKFGLAPVGCGWIIWRDAKYLPESLLFTLGYLGGSETTYTLNFSRPGYPLIYQYYSLVKNGWSGYRQLHLASLENARLLSDFLERTGYFDVLSDIHRPEGSFYKEGSPSRTETVANEHANEYYNPGLPVVAFKLTEKFKHKYPYIPQEAVSYMLRSHGYIIPNYTLPEAEQRYECLRIVVNSTLSLDLLDQLMEDIVKAVNKLISISSKGKIANPNILLEAIRTIAEADHNEEEHESKWIVNNSRC